MKYPRLFVLLAFTYKFSQFDSLGKSAKFSGLTFGANKVTIDTDKTVLRTVKLTTGTDNTAHKTVKVTTRN